MADCLTDPALDVATAAVAALLRWFGTEGQCPAKVGTTDTIRFFAGDGIPLAAWDAHSANDNCKEPFIWIRAARRFRSKAFPAATIVTDCDAMRVVQLELGVAWCAVVDQQPRWQDYATEADMSSDTAWRLESAVCEASGALRRQDPERLTAIDTLVPYGPEGGVIAWTGLLYATY